MTDTETSDWMVVKLPCDIPLPPATIIRAGCKLSTLIEALKVRGMAVPLSASPKGDDLEPPFAWHWWARNDVEMWPVWSEGPERPSYAPDSAIAVYPASRLQSLKAERDEARARFNDIDLCQHGQAPCEWSLKLIAKLEEAAEAENATLKREIAELREALTPSGDTKAAYIGEFAFTVDFTNEDGEDTYMRVDVPWTTVKEIMAAILDRATQGAAALGAKP